MPPYVFYSYVNVRLPLPYVPYELCSMGMPPYVLYRYSTVPYGQILVYSTVKIKNYKFPKRTRPEQTTPRAGPLLPVRTHQSTGLGAMTPIHFNLVYVLTVLAAVRRRTERVEAGGGNNPAVLWARDRNNRCESGMASSAATGPV